ncbi:helix-turn-helix domain-containing protein [Bacillus inaquosorum]|uniref:helix-turn-helix domain-containing protein n=1 Tax=Bacillus inaquosorum TaxID=483913 RepID=UPI00227FC08A|nr:helix-turn-helix transcriptional regulator [Bacillus inaquosorum]MCY8321136.1 helix-turn-helix domain-containing protein [Bacillus inaquosorum]MCY8336589.1 helix-turn-helix domain-containing protein [Bacillus inaquosorum]WIW27639.1 helix-turn-helix transcriptional regulator [Bacillus inaquosorum]
MENVKERKLLSNIRKSIGSQQIVADDLKISRQYLSALETGERNPTVKLMVKMSKYFNVSEKELFPDLFFEIECDDSLQKTYTA